MVENKLQFYKTRAGYNALKENIPNDSLVFVKETHEIITHGEEDFGNSDKYGDVAYIGDQAGTAITPEFNPQDDTVWTKDQVLSDTKKDIAQANIFNKVAGDGMGKVILKKNMVDGVNTLTQDMFYKTEGDERIPNTDTIYVIRYDYTLAEDITIPANCVLEFDGGSLNGGSLDCNDTVIIGYGKINTNLLGTIKSPIDLSLIGVVCDGVTDNTSTIVNFFNTLPSTFKGYFTVPCYCKFTRSTVYDAIPKSSILLNIADINGKRRGGWRSKHITIAGKDDENDDSRVDIVSGHFPALSFVNMGTCEYTEASSPSQKSGLLKKSCILFEDNFEPIEGGEGENGRSLIQLLGTLNTIDETASNREYMFQIRALHSFKKETSDGDVEGSGDVDYAVFTAMNNGYVGINDIAPNPQAELSIFPNRFNTNNKLSLILKNSRTSGSRDSTIIFSSLKDIENNTVEENVAELKYLGGGDDTLRLLSHAGKGLEIKKGFIEDKAFRQYNYDTLSGSTPTLTYGQIFYVNNSSLTTITNILLPDSIASFLGIIVLIFRNSNTTVANNNNIVLKSGNWDVTEGSVLILRKDTSSSNKWFELGRFDRVSTSGTFANRPTSSVVGFGYFCTDKQTTEGAADGIMIYHKGSDVWVDALGRVVS